MVSVAEALQETHDVQAQVAGHGREPVSYNILAPLHNSDRREYQGWLSPASVKNLEQVSMMIDPGTDSAEAGVVVLFSRRVEGDAAPFAPGRVQIH